MISRSRARLQKRGLTLHAGSSRLAVVKAIAEGTIKWEKDPDFGYLVATEVPGIDDADYLQPKKLYERQGRMDEYNQLVAKYNNDRREYLRKWKGLDEEIVSAI